MAKTLMVRPYVFAASSRAASSLFLRRAQPTRLFVSAVLFNRTRATCTKLQAHNDGNKNLRIEKRKKKKNHVHCIHVLLHFGETCTSAINDIALPIKSQIRK